MFSTFTTWDGANQEVQDAVAQGGVQTQGLKLLMNLEGTMVLNAEL